MLLYAGIKLGLFFSLLVLEAYSLDFLSASIFLPILNQAKY